MGDQHETLTLEEAIAFGELSLTTRQQEIGDGAPIVRVLLDAARRWAALGSDEDVRILASHFIEDHHSEASWVAAEVIARAALDAVKTRPQ